ncbi:hypothetical protein vseg_002328 [Gypsophila vaccaria]
MDEYCELNTTTTTTTTSLFSPSITTLSTPPSTRAVEGGGDTIPEPQTHLYRARLILENNLYDELLRRYRLAITRLSELASEANSLQEENEWLRLAYEDLNRGLDRLLMSSAEPPSGQQQLVGMNSTNNYNDIVVIGTNSPTSVLNNNNNNNNNDHDERVLLPKSISVPSIGYFKLKKSSTSPSTPSTPMTTTTTTTTPNNLSIRPSHDVNGIKLRVRRDVEKAIELDVYNQGMYKTELCNKWQQTNTCPYRDHCRFAHGLSELRPVIRHPRYKTQVCRMVLLGTTCPYGHRCHFRHST